MQIGKIVGFVQQVSWLNLFKNLMEFKLPINKKSLYLNIVSFKRTCCGLTLRIDAFRLYNFAYGLKKYFHI